MGNATERITSITKYNTLAQVEFGNKWAAMVLANGSKLSKVKLYKKGYSGNFFENEIDLSKLKPDGKGYECVAVSANDRKNQSAQAVQKLNGVAAQFPGNAAMKEIYQQKLLDFADLNPEEKARVLDFEKQMADTQAHQVQSVTGIPNGQSIGVPPAPGPVAR
ncbi:MAG: hypothetical protein U0892_15595 [Pirellulales bacterium]